MIENPVFLIRGIDWVATSAGIRCLHTLCVKLLERGEDAYLSVCKLQDGSKARTLEPDVLEGRPLILIEPEIIFGHRHDWADLTVRWLLNSPGKASTDHSGSWHPDDVLMHFDERFAMQGSLPLVVPHVDRTVFHNQDNPDDKKRSIDCFYARKAIYFGVERQCPLGALDVSPRRGHVQEGDWATLAQLFRKTRTFYTMEDTATSIEAALCGAKVEYILNPYQPTAPDIPDFVEWYKDLEARSSSEIDQFIELCYNRVGVKVYASA